MINSQRIVAVIPARGGSKGLPGKNIRLLAGKPLIVWTIEAARKSHYIDRIIVSTDSQEIANVSRDAGAEVPFMRPEELSTDSSKGGDVILHALDWLRDHQEIFELVLTLQPTSPLRTTKDIDLSIEQYDCSQARAIVSVCETSHSPLLCSTLPPDGNMGTFIEPKNIANRQDLPTYYRLNGAIYLSEVGYMYENRSSFGKDTYAYKMDSESSLDIDDLLTFQLAELMIGSKDIGSP